MPKKKEETVEKEVGAVKKTTSKKTSTKSATDKKTKGAQEKPKTKSVSKKKVVNNDIDKLDLSEDFNELLSFDVNLFRSLFMEIRKIVDRLYAKRERSEKDLAEYDDAIYNITANTVHESAAQDFMGFCYKKGFYDFCIMNYEKYMKWSILAAANGNAFTLSKLQIFLTTALDKLYEVENLDVIFDFLDLTEENFELFLSKMLCTEMVSILEISPESLIKMPEHYVEQNEELTKLFDKTKLQACDQVSVKLQKAIDQLLENLKKFENQQNEINNLNTPVETKHEETEVVETPIVESSIEKPVRFDKKSTIKKKFRY